MLVYIDTYRDQFRSSASDLCRGQQSRIFHFPRLSRRSNLSAVMPGDLRRQFIAELAHLASAQLLGYRNPG
jgi:hypothetical protein